MAILRGFPPSNTISPSVRIAEKDLSFVPAEQRFNRAGLVGFATKGPVNSPTLIRTTRHLHQVFGFPDPTMSAQSIYLFLFLKFQVKLERLLLVLELQKIQL
jgi:hypothetical protein